MGMYGILLKTREGALWMVFQNSQFIIFLNSILL